jgi:hypothetical protein
MVMRSYVPALLVAASVAACSIDDRVLTNDDPVGSAGASQGTAGDTTAGAGGSSTTGGGSTTGLAGSRDASTLGQGGSAGALKEGGADVAVPPDVESPLIDDFEDANSSLAHFSGRRGFWVTFNDATPGSVQTPAAGQTFYMTKGGANGSSYAARSTGKGFTSWGAVVAAIFFPGNPSPLYDISKYSGITFWAKVAAGSATTVRVAIPDKNTLPPSANGLCVETGGGRCNDHFQEQVTLSNDWTQYTIKYSELREQGWGVPQQPAFEPHAAQSIQFAFDAKLDFDFWLDDLSFVP